LVAAAVVAVGLLALGAGPAAARAPGVSYSSPGMGETLGSPVDIAGQAVQDNGRVDSLTMSLRSEDDPAHPVPSPVQFPGNGGSTLPFQWKPVLPWNGTYTVSTQAFGTDQPVDFNGTEGSAIVTRTFSLEIPPAAPGGLRATVDNTKRAVTLNWNANPEPDLVGYSVARKSQSGNTYQTLNTTTGTTYTDTIGTLPAATYTYQVRALRDDGTGSHTLLPSAPASTSGRVTSDPPSSTTTTTHANGSTGTTVTTTPSAGTTSSGNANLATNGKVDFSSFAALLDDKSKLPAAPRSSGSQEVDTGFNDQLPFDHTTRTSIVRGDDDPAQALGGQPVSSTGDERSSSLLFLAAGLLATVVLMHVLWLRGEVDRAPLPAIEPSSGEPPEA
jgi:hypothetical protein